PSSLFEEGKNIDLFNFNFEDFDSATEKIFYNKLNHLNAYMLFSLGNNIIEQWLSVSEYGNFFHRASAFLEVCMLFQNEYLKDDKTHPLIFIDVLDKSVFLSLFYLGKLAFFNQINFVQLQDMIFFLVKLTETLKVDIKKTEIFLSGNINFPKDKTISEIKKFFLHVYPFEFLNFFTTSPALKSLPVYKVNSLFNLPFCVS
ncbi:MAG TPA: DUF3822 family protein, partial [Bacteroidales bacterium]|nr:DUF3822 family protein [Bacteroidales bacterium]